MGRVLREKTVSDALLATVYFVPRGYQIAQERAEHVSVGTMRKPSVEKPLTHDLDEIIFHSTQTPDHVAGLLRQIVGQIFAYKQR